jgi:hypothetical protein
MMRMALLISFGTLLAACSGSNRLEDIIPRWANSPPPHPAPQYVTRKRQLEDVSKPIAESSSGSIQYPESQETKKPEVQHVSEVQNSSEE